MKLKSLFVITALLSTINSSLFCFDSKLTADLSVAVIGGDRERARKLLDEGADPNGTAEARPLVLAAWHGNRPIITLLLLRGAKVDAETTKGLTALMAAAQKDHESTVKFLLDRGASVGKKDARGYSALDRARKNNNQAIIKLLTEAENKNTAGSSTPKPTPPPQPVAAPVEDLINAIYADAVEQVRTLLSKNINLNTPVNGVLPLVLAAGLGNEEIVGLLLEKGAKVNEREPSSGDTALIAAAKKNRIEVVRILLAEGADQTIGNAADEKIALDYAKDFGNKEIVMLLNLGGKEAALHDPIEVLTKRDFVVLLRTGKIPEDPEAIERFKKYSEDFNYVDFLNSLGSTEKEIEKNYKKLSLFWHPDKQNEVKKTKLVGPIFRSLSAAMDEVKEAWEKQKSQKQD